MLPFQGATGNNNFQFANGDAVVLNINAQGDAIVLNINAQGDAIVLNVNKAFSLGSVPTI